MPITPPFGISFFYLPPAGLPAVSSNPASGDAVGVADAGKLAPYKTTDGYWVFLEAADAPVGATLGAILPDSGAGYDTLTTSSTVGLRPTHDGATATTLLLTDISPVLVESGAAVGIADASRLAWYKTTDGYWVITNPANAPVGATLGALVADAGAGYDTLTTSTVIGLRPTRDTSLVLDVLLVDIPAAELVESGSATGVAIATATPAIVLGVGALTLAGIAPVVVLGTVTYADVGALTLAGLAPMVAIDLRLTPDVGALTLDGLAPTVTATQNTQLLPDVGLLTLDGFAPDVQGDPVSLVPGGGFMQAIRRPKHQRITVWTYEEFAPTVLIAPAQRFRAVVLPKPVAVTAGIGTLALTGYAPSVSATLDDLSPTLDFADVRSGGSVPVSRAAVRTPGSVEVPLHASEAGPLTDEGALLAIVEQALESAPAHVASVFARTPHHVTVSPLTGQLALTGYAPSIEYGSTWSPESEQNTDDEDMALALVAYDLYFQ